jgi:hypothetical protein
VIRQQNKVGWNHIMLGRFGTEWRRIQARYSERIIQPTRATKSELQPKRTPEQWSIGLISVLWEQWYLLWDDRNQDVHGRDAQQRQSQLRQEVQRQLGEIYAKQQFMDSNVRSLLLLPKRYSELVTNRDVLICNFTLQIYSSLAQDRFWVLDIVISVLEGPSMKRYLGPIVHLKCI